MLAPRKYHGVCSQIVDDNEVLDFALRKRAALDLQHNDRLIRDREKLWRQTERSESKIHGHMLSDRSSHVWGIQSNKSHMEGGVVTYSQGRREAVNLVKPVPRGSTDARPGQLTRRGSAQVDANPRASLEPFAKQVVRHLGRCDEMELWRVGEFMKRQRGLNGRARYDGINMKSNIANCLRAFPGMFIVQTTSDGGAVTVAG